MTAGSAVNPLETEIRRLIRAAGPMPVARYMSLCLAHPRYGYYVTRDPFGAGGDFTTAPEVSQIFGELLGLWALSVWHMLERPEALRLIELGPGRGTMMRDALRAAKVVPQFRAALSVHMVEVSPTLEKLQRTALSDIDLPKAWHRDFLDVPPDGPAIVLANEYLDALPVHQAVKQADGWHERVIGLDDAGRFVLGAARDPIPQFERALPEKIRNAPTGAVFEWRDDVPVLDIAGRVREGAALFVDYGHVESDIGETVQAMNAHAFADPLSAPGFVDITAHVDFAALGRAAAMTGASVRGPVTQGRFLASLGIAARAQALCRAASPEQAASIEAGVARLTEGGRTGMGDLFKAMAVCDPKLGPLPGLDAP